MQQMFLWFHVTEAELREKKEIPTPIDTLSWDYYVYVKEHPIEEWNAPTHILYGMKDSLQSLEGMKQFAERFHCRLTLSEQSEHAFMGVDDMPVLEKWMHDTI